LSDCENLRRGVQWGAMKPPQRLRLEPRPSRIGCAAVAVGCAMTSILFGSLPLSMAAVLPGAAAILAVLASGLWRCAGRGVPALLHVGIDRRITVTDLDGRSRAGVILDDSYVGVWLTTIVWRRDGMPWWRPARTMLVLPDTLGRDEFRRLRVVLRYGRPAGNGDASGEEAG
jgi:hypothetical protein